MSSLAVLLTSGNCFGPCAQTFSQNPVKCTCLVSIADEYAGALRIYLERFAMDEDALSYRTPCYQNALQKGNLVWFWLIGARARHFVVMPLRVSTD